MPLVFFVVHRYDFMTCIAGASMIRFLRFILDNMLDLKSFDAMANDEKSPRNVGCIGRTNAL